jgi:hypothetical protein
MRCNLKELSVLLVLICLTLSIQAQNVDTYLKRDTFTLATEAISHKGYLYLIKGKGPSIISTTASEQPILYKLDHSLTIVDSLDLSTIISPTAQSVNAWISNLLFKGDDTLIVTLNLSYVNGNSSGAIILLDSAFNIFNQFSITQPNDSSVYFINNCKLYGNDLIVSGSSSLKSNAAVSSPYLAQVDVFGNKKKECVIPYDTFLTQPFPPLGSLLSLSDFAYVPSGFLASFYPYSMTTNLVLIDSSFSSYNLLSVKDKPWGYLLDSHIQFLELDGHDPKLITETSIFSDSIKATPNTIEYNKDYKNISLITLDSNYGFGSIDTFHFCENRVIDTIFQFSLRFDYGLFDVNPSKDTALVVSTDMEPSFFYSLKPVNTSYLTCFNPNTGGVYWSKTFNNGYAHDAANVVSLEGNRWFLAFNEYNWDKYAGENMSIHMMVIDGNGNPIGINEDEEKALAQEPIVYPNPANDYLTVANLHWPGNDYTYQISDANGRVVQKGALPIGGNITLAENLHGIYVLTITNQTGFGWARKVVLE